jgi:hypothetical protein
MIMGSTGCKNLQHIRQLIKDYSGQTSIVIEHLINENETDGRQQIEETQIEVPVVAIETQTSVEVASAKRMTARHKKVEAKKRRKEQRKLKQSKSTSRPDTSANDNRDGSSDGVSKALQLLEI